MNTNQQQSVIPQQQPAPTTAQQGSVTTLVDGKPVVMTEEQFNHHIASMSIEERVYDLDKDRQAANFFADLAEINGMHHQAAAIRNMPYDGSFSGGLKRTWNHQVRVSTLVKVAVVAGAVYLVYSGFAYFLGWPGGVFGKQDASMDALDKKIRR